MANQEKNNERAPYEAPRLFDLGGGIAHAANQEQFGGRCQNGNGAGGGCVNGNKDTGGGGADAKYGNCGNGNKAVSGACDNGNWAGHGCANGTKF